MLLGTETLSQPEQHITTTNRQHKKQGSETRVDTQKNLAGFFGVNPPKNPSQI